MRRVFDSLQTDQKYSVWCQLEGDLFWKQEYVGSRPTTVTFLPSDEVGGGPSKPADEGLIPSWGSSFAVIVN